MYFFLKKNHNEPAEGPGLCWGHGAILWPLHWTGWQLPSGAQEREARLKLSLKLELSSCSFAHPCFLSTNVLCGPSALGIPAPLPSYGCNTLQVLSSSFLRPQPQGLPSVRAREWYPSLLCALTVSVRGHITRTDTSHHVHSAHPVWNTHICRISTSL